MRSNSAFYDSYRKKSLARVDGGGCKQRGGVRDCGANGAIWIHTSEFILHSALFVLRVELAKSASGDFEVVLKNAVTIQIG